MTSETFVGRSGTFPDYGINQNWSGGAVPGLGTIAVINNAAVLVDPEKTLSARIVLQGGATLAGNGGGFVFADGSALSVEGADALYADGAVVNHGAMVLAGGGVLTVVVEAGAAIAQSFGLKIPSFENAGQVTVFAAATLAVEGTELSNTGAIAVAGGVLDVSGGGVDGGQSNQPIGGEIILEDGGSASFSDAVAGQRFNFNGAGTLSLSDVVDIDATTIRGFSTLDKILVTSTENGSIALRHLTFTGLPDHTAPEVVAGGGGAEILLEETPPCFARGTGLLTPTGYRAVETLRPDDPVVTASGKTVAVRWIGCRTLDIATHRRPEAVQPVRLLAGALSPGVPARALRLSPDHALLLDGVLVPVKLLINGATILRERGCVAVTYFHVELDRHDVLLAENLAVESYIDTGNRDMFETSSGMPRRNPVFGRGTQWNDLACAPLCIGGPILWAIRSELRIRTLALGYQTRTLTDIALWTGSGKLMRTGGTDETPAFRLGGQAGRVAIRSSRFVPAEFAIEGAGEADERLLGIALGGIRLDAALLPVGRLAVSGFHARAGGDVADWTDGNAEIEVPAGVATIGLQIVALPRGWINRAGNSISNA